MPPQVAGDAQKLAAKARETVLVVDDEADLLEIATLFLRDKGFEAIGARDGESALALLQQRTDIRLMMTDVTMPGINGIELARRARALNPKLPIVYCSGLYADTLLRQDAATPQGITLQKPFHWSEFMTAVRRGIRQGATNA